MFYIIDNERNKSQNTLFFEKACKGKYDYQILDPIDFDFTSFQCSPKDAFYRVLSSRNSKVAFMIEKFLMERGLKNIRKKDYNKLNFFERQERYSENNIPNIPTIPFVTFKQEVLENYVEQLDGFPIVIKESGSSCGNQILKVDSMSSLISCLNYVMQKASAEVYLKKFIEHDKQARVIILGEKVIATKMNCKVNKDIRLNNDYFYKEEVEDISKELKVMVIKIAELLKLNFAGIDIIFGKDGNNYLAEVNAPCDFSYTQKVTGVDIASQIVNFLN